MKVYPVSGLTKAGNPVQLHIRAYSLAQAEAIAAVYMKEFTFD